MVALLVKENKGRMHSEGSLFHPLVSFPSHFRTPRSPKLKPPFALQDGNHKAHNQCINKNGEGKGKRRMIATTKKLLTTLFFIISAFSLVRLLKITSTTSSSSFIQLRIHPSDTPPSHTGKGASSIATLNAKELRLLSNTISTRIPCNLLIFGSGPQYLVLSALNAGGTTIFLEDNPETLRAIRTNDTGIHIYKVEHHAEAKDAYKLLKHARADLACAPQPAQLQVSNCSLALTRLPKKVYKIKWDVIVVDGPVGDRPEAPGRMNAIYTAALLARSGNMTDVLIHDVDRIVEKWFSWEFMCEENLVASKGKLWHFRIKGNSSLKSFCSNVAIQIL